MCAQTNFFGENCGVKKGAEVVSSYRHSDVKRTKFSFAVLLLFSLFSRYDNWDKMFIREYTFTGLIDQHHHALLVLESLYELSN